MFGGRQGGGLQREGDYAACSSARYKNVRLKMSPQRNEYRAKERTFYEEEATNKLQIAIARIYEYVR